jgi:hypothetical protein
MLDAATSARKFKQSPAPETRFLITRNAGEPFALLPALQATAVPTSQPAIARHLSGRETALTASCQPNVACIHVASPRLRTADGSRRRAFDSSSNTMGDLARAEADSSDAAIVFHLLPLAILWNLSPSSRAQTFYINGETTAAPSVTLLVVSTLTRLYTTLCSTRFWHLSSL